jgi:C_GCAxxG_C_C family probable redox protein
MSKADAAVSCFESGFNCSQAVFSTYCEQLGLNQELALKISGAFGGGMAHIGETCGAVTSALMLIGLKYGRTRLEDTGAKEKTYALTQEFVKRFKAINGSVKCTDLIGCNLSTDVGLSIAKEKNLAHTICPKFVKDSAEIIEQFLFER